MLLSVLLVGLITQLVREGIEIKLAKQVVDCLCTHLGDELVGVIVLQELVALRQTVHDGFILIFGKEIELLNRNLLVLRHHTWLNHDIALVIDYCIEFLGGNAKQITYLVRQRTEIPDVSHRHHKLDVSAALTANLLLCYLHAATVADVTLVTNALVLAAQESEFLSRVLSILRL